MISSLISSSKWNNGNDYCTFLKSHKENRLGKFQDGGMRHHRGLKECNIRIGHNLFRKEKVVSVNYLNERLKKKKCQNMLLKSFNKWQSRVIHQLKLILERSVSCTKNTKNKNQLGEHIEFALNLLKVDVLYIEHIEKRNKWVSKAKTRKQRTN